MTEPLFLAFFLLKTPFQIIHYRESVDVWRFTFTAHENGGGAFLFWYSLELVNVKKCPKNWKNPFQIIINSSYKLPTELPLSLGK